MSSLFRRLFVLSACLAALLLASEAQARSAGIASNVFLGLPTPSCNGCHSGGVAPTVSLVASAATIDVGATVTLTFTVTTVNGNPGAAGFNVRSNKQGTFSVGGPNSANTRILTGTSGWSEATHTAPKAGEPATFTVLWTPSSGTTGEVIFTAWGNAVNANGTNRGDRAGSDTETITVQTMVCTTTFYRDVDGDGYGSATSGTQVACATPSGYVSNNTDCNDGAPAVHPGASEACNGVDDDCTGGIDNGLATSTFYRDADGDTFGNPSLTKVACNLAQAGAGYVANNTDCNDGSMAINPNAIEVCNGIDDNCAGGIDNGLPTSIFYRDADNDTFGNPAVTKTACNLAQAGAGYVANNSDCNDGSTAINPNATETCNGVDDNCAGGIDNGLPTSTFYRDADGDTFGSATTTKTACSLAVAGPGYVTNATDCNDGDRNIYPGAPEICSNNKDDNCNNVVDTDAPANSTFYRDGDGDGYGAAASGTAQGCAPPTGYVSRNDDCNDGDTAVHPSATEVCNGKDDDCEGGTDEGFGTKTCGIGECSRTVQECSQGAPQTCTPGTPVAEICGNGKDENCNDDIDEGCMDGGTDAGDGGSDGSTEDGGSDATSDASDDVADAGSDASPPDGGPPGSGGAGGAGGGGAGGGGAGGTSGAVGTAGTGAGARPPSGSNPPADSDDGCGCRAADADSRGWSLLLLGGLFSLGLFGRRAVQRTRR
jgi:hypothetical protein